VTGEHYRALQAHYYTVLAVIWQIRNLRKTLCAHKKIFYETGWLLLHEAPTLQSTGHAHG